MSGGFKLTGQDYSKWCPGDRRPETIVEVYETRAEAHARKQQLQDSGVIASVVGLPEPIARRTGAKADRWRGHRLI